MSDRVVIERNGSSITYRSAKSFEVPNLDLLSLLFDSPQCSAKEDTIIHLDAEDTSLALTKAQARDLTRRFAHTFRHRFGIRNGKAVTCISSGNHIVPVVFYGCVAAGGVLSSVSSSSTIQDVVRLIKGAPSDVVVCNADTKAVAISAAKECGLSPDRVLVIDSGKAGTLRSSRDGKDVVGKEMLDWERITSREKLATTTIALIYSSGTTGLPKGVPLTHLNMVGACSTVCDMTKAEVARRVQDFQYRTIAHLPIAHIAGMQGYFVNPFYMGGPTYWMSKFDFEKFLEYNRRYRITFFFTVPPIYLLLAKSPQVTNQFDTNLLALTGAAPMGKDLQHAAMAKLGKGKTFISQTWGLSETTGSATYLSYGESDDTGSVSPLIPNLTARVVDDDGKDLKPGVPGEILLKGPTVFRGYHNNPEADHGAFTDDGYFCTGDIGFFKNGLLYVVDRKKELIKYKGLQVAPAELEALLLSHPLILDAAVVGVDYEGTEAPRAYIVADKNKISADEVKNFVKEHVASYKQLRGGIIYLEAIPKSAAGKILRKDLRELAKKESAGPRSKL